MESYLRFHIVEFKHLLDTHEMSFSKTNRNKNKTKQKTKIMYTNN